MPTPAVNATWQIDRDATDADAYGALATDRHWNGYSIADLAPPLRQWTRVAVARPGTSAATAACLFYQHPLFNSTIPHGDPEGVAAILDAAAEAGELPAETYILARHAHLPQLARHYDFPHSHHEMLRMAVSGATFIRPTGTPIPVARLGDADLQPLLDLYADYPDSAFTPDQLAHGVFYGVYEGGRLLAAGGTHVVAPQYGIAAVGNVYTAPEARGRGLGGAVAAAVTADLLAGPCRDVILNVVATNEPAVRIYRRLGFAEHCPYVEARAVLK
jgi:ribosomal protein S18 acetylase RimI-like enzyme